VYVLNQGGMDGNNATLDYWDSDSALYTHDIYAAANPSVAMDLGNVGNDLAVYGSRLYAVINGSNKVEVMDVATAKRLGQVNVPNCRYIAFADGYAYVTSYAPYDEAADVSDNGAEGYVAKIDTSTLQIVAKCKVGLQPDGIAVSGGYLYVANSGGYHGDYMTGEGYGTTLSVVALSTFTQLKTIEVGANPDKVVVDRHGTIWLTLRGNYNDVSSDILYVTADEVGRVSALPVAASAVAVAGDSLYFIGTQYDAAWNTITSYGIINTSTKEVVSDGFITDGSADRISTAYSIYVNSVLGEIYIGDAGNYVNPGYVFCYGRDGRLKWQEMAGVAPAAFAGR
jgi:hypothetical protein